MIKLLLLLLSGGKALKLLLSVGSMLFSVWVYAMLFGWPYAVAFIALVLLHELGHTLAARKRGMSVGWPMMIPFVAAWVTMQQPPQDAETEAYVGLGGPLAGTLGSMAVYFYARDSGPTWLLAAAYTGFLLNLLSLIPLPPLDGGRITSVLGPRFWLLGVPVLMALFFYRPSPLLIVVAIVAAPQVWRAIRWNKADEEARAYYDTSSAIKLEYGAYYLLLVVFLAFMSHEVHGMLEATRNVQGTV